jgi:Na+/melibiose symporter-like transporter
VAALTTSVALAYLAYSWLTVAHHAVGTAVVAQGTRAESLYSVREALALGGVLLGSVLPLVAGWVTYGWATAALLGLGLWLLAPHWAVLRAAPSEPEDASPQKNAQLFSLWQDRRLRRTWTAFFISNVSGSLPATLLGFFVADVLGLGLDAAPRYLAIYFVAAALGFAAWPKLAARYGTARVWAAAMLANGAIFAGAAFLNAGVPMVAWWYGAVCFGTGLLLGAELMLPQSWVASHLAATGQAQQAGSVFGWWTFAQKTALALAAGVGLWGLAWLGYVPSTVSTPASGAQPLVWLYCVVPCALKIVAAALAFNLDKDSTT